MSRPLRPDSQQHSAWWSWDQIHRLYWEATRAPESSYGPTMGRGREWLGPCRLVGDLWAPWDALELHEDVEDERLIC